jgi:hypothetical protein
MRAIARAAHHASLREDDLNQVQRDSLSEAAYCRSPAPPALRRRIATRRRL